MSDQGTQSAEENPGSSSPLLFEDSQNYNGNDISGLEVVDISRNESNEALLGVDISADKSKATDDSEAEDSPQMRPGHDLFSKQQRYLTATLPSTSSPLRYPMLSSSHSSLSLSKNKNIIASQVNPIEEDSPNASMTPLDGDIGSFGSLSGVSADNSKTEHEKNILNLKRKNPADESNDSDLEILSTGTMKDTTQEETTRTSQEETPRKKVRQSVECVYVSTPHRSGSKNAIPPFQASDVSEMKSIPEEYDTSDDIGHLHFSPSQDVDKQNILTQDRNIEGLKKIITASQEVVSSNSGSNSDSIFSQVNKMAVNSGEILSAAGSVTITGETKTHEVEDDDDDTIELEVSDDGLPDPVIEERKETVEKPEAVTCPNKGKEGFVLVNIKYDISEDGKSMENIKLAWQASVVPEIVADVSSSVRSSSSPVSQSSHAAFSLADHFRATARASILSSSSGSSSGGNMLPPPVTKLPASAFKFLNQKVMLKQDLVFRADGLLKVDLPPDDVTKQAHEPQDAVSRSNKELQLETPAGLPKVVASGSRTRSTQRSRKKGGSARGSAKSKTVKTRSAPPRKKQLIHATSNSNSPEPLPFNETPQASKTNGNETQKSELEETLKLSQVSSLAASEDDTLTLKPGKSVLAKWADGLYYSGKLGQYSISRWEIHFDDGEKLSVHEDNIVVAEKIPAGQPVLAALQPNCYYPGIISGHIERAPRELVYIVDLDQKGKHEVKKAQLCLTQHQLNTYRIESCAKHLTTPPRKLDVSLDNMLEGKRSRSKRHLEMINPGSTRASAGRTRGTSDPQPGSSKIESTANIKNSVSDSQSEVDTLWQPEWELIPGVEECEWPETENKKKSNTGQDSGSQSERESDLDSQDQEDKLIFDKLHLTQQLRKAGGTVVEFFENYQLSQGVDKCLLITNRSNASAKSIMCLSLGVKSVKFSWVIHCCSQDKFIPLNGFYLPLGKYHQSYQKIEWSDRPKNAKPFTDSRIAILSSQTPNFTEFWRKILTQEKAGKVFAFTYAEFLQIDKKTWDSAIYAHCLVTEGASEELEELANKLDVPLVRSSWLIQSLMEGKTVSFALHQYNAIKDKNLSAIFN